MTQVKKSMPVWWSTKMLAEAKLSGMPTTVRKMNAKAEREGWRNMLTADGRSMCRKRPGRGGGYEYRIDVLSPTQRDQLIARYQVDAGVKPAQISGRVDIHKVEAAWEEYEAASERKKAEAEMRYKVLLQFEAHRRDLGRVRAAVEKTAAQTGVSAASIYNWRNLVKPVITDKQHWVAYLLPRHRGKSVVTEYSEEAWRAWLGLYMSLEQRPATACYHWVKKAAGEQGWVVPSLGVLTRRFKAEIPWAMQVLAREGRDALWRMYPAQRRDRSMFHALEGVQADGHKIDVWVRFPDGEVTRPMITMVSDVYSNKFLGWHIAKSESATAVRLAFRQVFVNYGIPDWALMDNGRAFASKQITGGQKNRYRFKVQDDELDGILTALGIKVHWAEPGRGQSKPIERTFQDVCNYVAKAPHFAGAYTGNSPVNKPAYTHDPRDHAVDFELFRAVFDESIRDINAREGRRTGVCNGRSFDQAFEESYKTVPIRKASAQQLRMILMKAERITARKPTGELHLHQNRFWAEFLTEHIGQKLTLRYDPEDIHAGVHVYDHDSKYLGHAALHGDVGFHSEDAAREQKRKRRQYVRNIREAAAFEEAISLKEFVKSMPEFGEPEPAPEAPLTRLFTPATRGSAAAQAEIETTPEESSDAFQEAFARGLKLIKTDREI